LQPAAFSGRKGKGRGAMCKLKNGKFVNSQMGFFTTPRAVKRRRAGTAKNYFLTRQKNKLLLSKTNPSIRHWRNLFN